MTSTVRVITVPYGTVFLICWTLNLVILFICFSLDVSHRYQSRSFITSELSRIAFASIKLNSSVPCGVRCDLPYSECTVAIHCELYSSSSLANPWDLHHCNWRGRSRASRRMSASWSILRILARNTLRFSHMAMSAILVRPHCKIYYRNWHSHNRGQTFLSLRSWSLPPQTLAAAPLAFAASLLTNVLLRAPTTSVA